MTKAELITARIGVLHRPHAAVELERLCTSAYRCGAMEACRTSAWRAAIIAPSRRSLNLLASAESQLTDDPARSLPAFRRALCFFPGEPRNVLAIAQIYVRASETNRARRAARLATRLKPDLVGVWIRLARLLLDNSDFLAAEPAARRAIILRPEAADALKILIRVHLRHHGVVVSLRAQRHYAVSTPQDLSAWQNLLRSANEIDDAELDNWLAHHCPPDQLRGDKTSLVRAIAALPDALTRLMDAAPRYCQDAVAMKRAIGFFLEAGRAEEIEAICRLGLMHDPQSSRALGGMFQVAINKNGAGSQAEDWLRRLLMNRALGPHRAMRAFYATVDPGAIVTVIEGILPRAASANDHWLARMAINLAAQCKKVPSEELLRRVGIPAFDRALGDHAQLYVRENLMIFRHASGSVDMRVDIPRKPALAQSGATTEEQSTLSIVVPMGNRLEDLKSMVDSVLAQTSNQLQIVFSVLADNQGTRAFLDRTVNMDPRCLIVEEKAELFSKVRAIENGIRAAHGDLILMLDCDCALVRSDTYEQIQRLLLICPADIYSIDYRGMILLRRSEFTDANRLRDKIVAGQARLDRRIDRLGIGSDDIVWICEHITNRRSRYALVTASRTERVSLSRDGHLTLSVESATRDIPRLINHLGEHRITARRNIHARGNVLNTKDDIISDISDITGSFGFEPYITQIRRYVSRRLAATESEISKAIS